MLQSHLKHTLHHDRKQTRNLNQHSQHHCNKNSCINQANESFITITETLSNQSKLKY